MKKITGLVCLYLICCFAGFAQLVQDENQFIPPSPTVAELGKYGKIPVSHYTGIPQISVPLYTLQCGQLTLPVSLTYHAGGIRVDQIASWVGLGWSLNAGGIITSTVLGASDVGSNAFPVDTFELFQNRLPTLSELQTLTYKSLDTQPDIFSYNFMGYSGQFIIDRNTNTCYDIRNNLQLKILRDASGFKIIDQQGTVYKFGLYETTDRQTSYFVYNLGSALISHPDLGDSHDTYVFTAWFLTSITSADGTDIITFAYESETQEYDTKMEGKLTYDRMKNQWIGNPASSDALKKISPFGKSYITNNTFRLKAINASNGVAVNFQESEYTRRDLSGSKRLEQITVYGTGGELLREWNFNYDYFGSYIKTNSPLLDERLKLTSVVQDGEQTYSFNYYGELPGEPGMPFRSARCGYDYWGYANGIVTEDDAQDINKIFPKIDSLKVNIMYSEVSGGGTGGGYFNHISGEVSLSFPGSNKNPDENYMKAYTLKELHYPAGGYSKFNYEAHDYTGSDTVAICGGLRIKSIENYDGENLTDTVRYKYTMFDSYSAEHGSYSSGSIINKFVPWLLRHHEKQYWRPSPKGSSGSGPYIIYNMTKSISTNTVELSSSSYTSIYSYGGDYIGYSFVTETSGNGFTVYEFYSINDFPNTYTTTEFGYLRTNMLGYFYHKITKEYTINHSSHTYPFMQGFWGKCYGRGLVKNIYTYNKDNELVRHEENRYLFEDKHRVYGIETDVDYEYSLPGERGDVMYPYHFYRINVYFHQTGQALPVSKKTVVYGSGVDSYGSLTTEEKYQYNKYNQVSQVLTYNSDGTVLTDIYKYPSDITDPPDTVLMKKMEDKYIISPVIKTEKRTRAGANIANDKVFYADYKKYKEVYSGIFRPEKIYLLETATPISISQNYSSRMKEEIHYDYNKKGKVSQIIKKTDIPAIYLWGYSGQYPVAEIKGVTYSDIVSILGQTLIDRVSSAANPAVGDLQQINNLRNNPNLSSSQVTTYTYKPLVGMLTATDPRGVTTYYDYDDFGRLKETYYYENGVKTSANKRKVEEYKYHYRQ